MHLLAPGDNFVLTRVIIGVLSAWGGLVRYILDTNNEEDEWRWAAVISQIIVSGFTGLIGGLISFEGGTSRYPQYVEQTRLVLTRCNTNRESALFFLQQRKE